MADENAAEAMYLKQLIHMELELHPDVSATQSLRVLFESWPDQPAYDLVYQVLEKQPADRSLDYLEKDDLEMFKTALSDGRKDLMRFFDDTVTNIRECTAEAYAEQDEMVQPVKDRRIKLGIILQNLRSLEAKALLILRIFDCCGPSMKMLRGVGDAQLKKALQLDVTKVEEAWKPELAQDAKLAEGMEQLDLPRLQQLLEHLNKHFTQRVGHYLLAVKQLNLEAAQNPAPAVAEKKVAQATDKLGQASRQVNAHAVAIANIKTRLSKLEGGAAKVTETEEALKRAQTALTGLTDKLGQEQKASQGGAMLSDGIGRVYAAKMGQQVDLVNIADFDGILQGVTDPDVRSRIEYARIGCNMANELIQHYLAKHSEGYEEAGGYEDGYNGHTVAAMSGGDQGWNQGDRPYRRVRAGQHRGRGRRGGGQQRGGYNAGGWGGRNNGHGGRGGGYGGGGAQGGYAGAKRAAPESGYVPA